ncbi:MAG TPA: cytochrome c4 [Gammaproteobacteria bacterium]|nr:cytochrome c4 [Gammaproteobacteria bacterium]
MTSKTSLAVVLWGLLMAGFTGTVLAAYEGGDPKAGEAKSALCGGCHGPDGNSPDATFPRLAGQYEGYIVKQIHDFKKGLRTNNDTMAGMAATVASIQDAKDIGAYFHKQKMAKKPLTPVNKALAAKGEKLFKNGNPRTGVYGCINCHGPRGKGKAKNITQFPVIGGQHRDYIIKQLKDFKAGRRHNDPGGMMADIAKRLSNDEIRAVAEYLSAQLP